MISARKDLRLNATSVVGCTYYTVSLMRCHSFWLTHCVLGLQMGVLIKSMCKISKGCDVRVLWCRPFPQVHAWESVTESPSAPPLLHASLSGEEVSTGSIQVDSIDRSR